jgi:hypothetical protein
MLCAESSLKFDVVGVGDSAPIHWAAQSCVPGIVKLVIDAGANVRARNNHGESAIFFALRFPIHKESEPELRDKDISDQIATLKLLVEAGLSVNDRRDCGNDKLLAVVNYLTRTEYLIDVRVVDYLFSAGLDPEIVVKPEGSLRQGDQLLENTRFGSTLHTFIAQKLQKMGFTPRQRPGRPA